MKKEVRHWLSKRGDYDEINVMDQVGKHLIKAKSIRRKVLYGVDMYAKMLHKM